MFKCQYSNEISDPVVYQVVEVYNEEVKQKVKVKRLISAAETPVTIVVSTRPQTYTNFAKGRNGQLDFNKPFTTHGEEIVKEIKVRPKYEQEVRDLIAAGQLDKLKKAFRRR